MKHYSAEVEARSNVGQDHILARAEGGDHWSGTKFGRYVYFTGSDILLEFTVESS